MEKGFETIRYGAGTGKRTQYCNTAKTFHRCKTTVVKHYGLHFAKYVGLWHEESYKKTKPVECTLGILVSLSAANTLHQDLSKKSPHWISNFEGRPYTRDASAGWSRMLARVFSIIWNHSGLLRLNRDIDALADFVKPTEEACCAAAEVDMDASSNLLIVNFILGLSFILE